MTGVLIALSELVAFVLGIGVREAMRHWGGDRG